MPELPAEEVIVSDGVVLRKYRNFIWILDPAPAEQGGQVEQCNDVVLADAILDFLEGSVGSESEAGDAALAVIQDEGTPLAGAPHDTINFVGAGVSAADAGGGKATVTIPGGGGGGIQPEIKNAIIGGTKSPAANSTKPFSHSVAWWQLQLQHTTKSGLVVQIQHPGATVAGNGLYATIPGNSIVAESVFTILQEPAAGQATPTFFDNGNPAGIAPRGVKVFFIANSVPGTYRWSWTWTGANSAITGELRIDLDPV